MKKKILSEEMKKDLFQKLSSAINLKDSNFYEINRKDAEKLFTVLNDEVFGGKLPLTRFVIEKIGRTNLNTIENIAEFRVAINKESEKRFKLSHRILDLELIFYILMFNIGKLKFESTIGIILHEMIHENNYFYNGGEERLIRSLFHEGVKNEEDRNPVSSYSKHGKFFEKEMKRIKEKTGIDVEKEFDLEKEMPKDLQEAFDKIKESKSFVTNGCKDKFTLKLAKVFRRGLLDDGTNRVEIRPDGTIEIAFI